MARARPTDLLESGTFGLHTADSERPEEQLHARRLRQTLQAAIERLPSVSARCICCANARSSA